MEHKVLKEKKMRLAVLALALLSLLVFVNTFQNEFVGYDDQNLIQANQSIRSLSPENVAQMFTPRLRGNYQPVRALSYAFDYAVWGLRPFGFHLTNILFHVLSVVGVFLVLQLLLPWRTALLSAAFFAVLPIHVESVAWMSSRKDVLSLTFFLFAIYFYERSSSTRSAGLYVASLVATALALLSKLTAVTLPFCILLVELCRDGWPSLQEWKKKVVRLAPVFLLVMVVIGLNFLKFQQAPQHGDALAPLEQAGTSTVHDVWLSMPLVVWRYIRLTLLPYHLSTHYEVTRVTSAASAAFLIPFLLLVTVAAAAVIAFFRGRRLIAFCIGWFFITFLPTSNIIPTAALLVDRYMHIPSIGLAALVGIAAAVPLEAAEQRINLRKAAVIPVVLLILLFSVLTVRRNADWRTTYSLFERTLAVNPRSVDARLALGSIYDKEGALDSAVEMYREALKVEPHNYRVLYNLGVTYLKKGWLTQAVQALEESRAAHPSFVSTRFNLALAYEQHHQLDKAIAEQKEVLKLNPRFAAAHGALGRMYLEQGDYDSALQEVNLALQSQPDLVPALVDRAKLLVRQGEYDKAEEDLRKLSLLGLDVGKLRMQLQDVRGGGNTN